MKETKADNTRRKQTKTDVWHFRDLIVWQKAMVLARDVHRATAAFPKAEMFGLTSQLRRAAVSVASNIAEGAGRTTQGEMRLFFGHGRGSVYEVETQLCIAESLAYIDRHACKNFLNSVGKLSAC